MTLTATVAGAGACLPPHGCPADVLRALAEAAVDPASAALVARLNPAHPEQATRTALAELCDAGLAEPRPHPLTRLLTAYALTGAGRRWVRQHG
jgi:hypothetical protein